MLTEVKGSMDSSTVTMPSQKLQRIVVAHDASEASEKALRDAVSLARQFRAEIVIAHVEPPVDLSAEDSDSFRRETVNLKLDVGALVKELESSGVRSTAEIRCGAVGDMLFDLCCQQQADLLMMGAYGHGDKERSTLGSTTEQLLRAVPCPVFTYGPLATSTVLSSMHFGPVLLPVSLPMQHEQLDEGIALAKLFGVSLDVFHAVDYGYVRDARYYETQTLGVAKYVRERGIRADWSYMYGQADRTIMGRALSLDSPFILMPLRWRKGLSAANSDNVAAHVVRLSTVPVLSYRCD